MTSQILPPNESFAPPSWLNRDVGTQRDTGPFYYWYAGLAPGVNVSTSGDYSIWPFKSSTTTIRGTSNLFVTDNLGPAWCTDPNFSGLTQEAMRGFVARETASFDSSSLSYKATFVIRSAQSSALGPANGGRLGSSPSAGYQPFPPVSVNDDKDNFLLGSGGPSSSWVSGGSNNARSYVEKVPIWSAWRGNCLFFRVGGGYPVFDYTGSIFSARDYYYTNVNWYCLAAYPEINVSTNETDAIFEVWSASYSGSGSSTGTLRRLFQQKAPGAVQYIKFDEPYHLRVQVENATASPTSDVEIKCFVGKYAPASGATQNEIQLFVDGVFASDVYAAGAGVSHNTTTGAITDSNASRISAYSDKTIGWAMGRDRVTDIAPYINPSSTETKTASFVEGVVSIEVEDTSTATVVYRDLFDRSVGYEPVAGANTSIIQLDVNQFGAQGPSVKGMFGFDGHSHNWQSGSFQIGRLLRATDSDLTNSPGSTDDFCYADYDRVDGTATTSNVWRVMRQFTHLRPSTQQYNHHRYIEFRPGAEHPDTASPLGGLSSIDYQFGLCQRGTHSGRTIRGLVCYLGWQTDADNTVTEAKVVISERQNTYNQLDPELLELVIASRTWSGADVATFNSLFPIYDGNFHSLSFRSDFFGSPSTPDSAARYSVELDGTPIELSDPEPGFQSSPISPYYVIHSSPNFTNGRQEAFYFQSNNFEVAQGGGGRNYDMIAVRNWTELALADDPDGSGGDADSMPSIPVNNEGAPVGYLNANPGALAISGGGVWEVESMVTVNYSYPIRGTRFDSGHAYTGSMDRNYRRLFSVMVQAASLELAQSLQDFYNSHNGSEIPFYFIVPIPSDGYDDDEQPEEQETAIVYFSADSLEVNLIGPSTYNCSFELEEAIVQ